MDRWIDGSMDRSMDDGCDFVTLAMLVVVSQICDTYMNK